MTKKIIKRIGLIPALALSILAMPATAQENFLTAGSAGMVSGPDVGERVPDFADYDQNNNLVSLDDVMGPNGALILFQRSADW